MESLRTFRAVVLHGPRQAGKTTLARLIAADLGSRYVTLDSEGDRAAAEADPPEFLAALGTPLVIDEIQRVGNPLVLAVKQVVDTDRRPGRYLITGSTNFLTIPTIAETLAGRIDIVALWPLSMGELFRAAAPSFVDRAFASAPTDLLRHPGVTPDRDEYLQMVCRGGYPEVERMAPAARRRWFARYVQTVVQREIETAADIRGADAMRRMVRLLAALTSQELVISALAERLGVARSTAEAYEPWLETVFLAFRVPAWSRNLSTKVVHRPKLFMTDSGVAAGLLGKEPGALRRPTDPATGPLMKTFVAGELAKQLTWSETPAELHHYRDSDGTEVDLVLEAADGRVVAVEVKATSTPRAEDFRSLARIRDRLDRLGDDFCAGVVLHTGNRRLVFGDRLIALPMADLWT